MVKKFLVFTLIFGGLSMVQAQDQKPNKKVVIINKTNDNGKITETRKEAEGEDADKLIEEMKADGIENINIDTEGGTKTISITKSTSKTTSKDGKDEDTNIKIIKIDGDNVNEMEWEGDGDMPEEMAKELKNIQISKTKDGENMMITIDTDKPENGKKMEWAEGKPRHQSKKMIRKGENNDRYYFPTKERQFMYGENANNNKVTLGVMIDDTDDGVVIGDIVDGSAAAKAGLRRGDTILKINDKYIFTSDGLLKALSPFNPGESIKVRYIRDGKEKSVKATLSKRL
jgi:hypothetical protein